MTQKYNKVTWQDETTSQQGTLINAERLDQMQTAHHYADGFEEVDTVPTEDPDVDYHKVVFCTADTTFYRWDGTQWVKDVDDDTKALLLAHEADHNNPHVVTKAQVGLGNCDNTADLDKPVSTAQQTALDGKVDKNASITGATKTKITYDSKGLVTAGNDLIASDIPDIAISQVTGLQTVLDAKMDDTQIKTAWSSPVSDDNIASEKLVKDTIDGVAADLATHEADTANPHSVTKAQVGLGNVDNKGTVSAWQVTPDNDHIPTEKLVKDSLGDGSVTKLGTVTVGGDLKPIYLNAGVPTAVANDLVSTAGNQTIAGVKTFTKNVLINSSTSSTYPRIIIKNSRVTRGTAPSQRQYSVMDFVDSTGDESASSGTRLAETYVTVSSEGNSTFRNIVYNCISGNTAQFELVSDNNNNTYATAPNRTYDASNTSDIVNIALLDAYTPMVRTTGAQSIGGDKTYNDALITSKYPMLSVPNSYISVNTNKWIKLYSWTISNVQRGIILRMFSRADRRSATFTISGNEAGGALYRESNWNGLDTHLRLAYETATSKIVLMCNLQRVTSQVVMSGISNSTNMLPITTEDSSVEYDEPTVGDTYTWVNGTVST